MDLHVCADGQDQCKISCPLCDGLGTSWFPGRVERCMLCRGDGRLALALPMDRIVAAIGKAIGFGRLMQLGQEMWKESLVQKNLAGGELSIGPCVAMLVPCPCGDPAHCDWCCGSGRVTERVAQAMRESKP